MWLLVFLQITITNGEFSYQGFSKHGVTSLQANPSFHGFYGFRVVLLTVDRARGAAADADMLVSSDVMTNADAMPIGEPDFR